MSSDKVQEEAPSSPDIHFEPIVSLAKVETKTLEEDEEEIFRMRAKLFRYIIGQHDTKPEWKERGIGDVKILKHKSKHAYRLVMRREKTLKVCANHFLNKDMELRPNCGSDRAWVWNVQADFADEEPQKETLAIRFSNAENAKKFKEIFEKCKENIGTKMEDAESDKLASELESLKVKGEDESTSSDQQPQCNGEAADTTEEEVNEVKEEIASRETPENETTTETEVAGTTQEVETKTEQETPETLDDTTGQETPETQEEDAKNKDIVQPEVDSSEKVTSDIVEESS